MTARRFPLALLLAVTPLLHADITGVVMTRDGVPIKGATVSAFRPESTEQRMSRVLSDKPQRAALVTASSDDQGRFTLAVKEAGAIDVQVDAAGYAPEARSAQPVDDLGAIGLPAAPTKTGRITAGGKAVSGAVVLLSSSDAEVVAVTDGEGKYSAPDPAKWVRSVRVFHHDFAPYVRQSLRNEKLQPDHSLQSGKSLRVKVVAADGKTAVAKSSIDVDGVPSGVTGDDGVLAIPHIASDWQEIRALSGNLSDSRSHSNDAELTLRLRPSASISGTVRDAKSGKPLAGASIIISRSGRFFDRPQGGQTVISDAKGNFSVSGLSPAAWRVSASYPGHGFQAVESSLRDREAVVRTISLSPLGRIIGTVVDEGKRPVAAATISLNPLEIGSFNFGRLEAVMSGPDGRFVMSDVAIDTQFELKGLKRGMPATTAGPIELAPAEVKPNVTLVIPSGITVSGKVLDSKDRPVSGAEVTTRDAERGGARRIFIGGADAADQENPKTGSDGTFSVKLKEGAYDFTFKAPGFAPKNENGYRVSRASEPMTIHLEPGNEVRGRVVRSDGSGISDVRVSQMRGDSPDAVVTSPDGSFIVSDLPTGTVALNFMKPDESIMEMRSVNAPVSDLVVTISNGGTVRGRVVDKATKKPITDFSAGISGERSMGQMRMMMPTSLKPFRSDDGSFTLEHVRTGSVQLVVESPGYVRGTVSGLDVVEGKPLENVEVALEAGARVVGKVTGPDGDPLEGVFVQVAIDSAMGRMGSMMNDGTQSDAAGEYVLDGVAPGDRTISFNRDGYASEKRTTKLANGETRLDVKMTRGATLQGVVVDESGAPVAAADVMAMGESEASSKTDASGMFELKGLASHVTIVAGKAGYPDTTIRDVDPARQGRMEIVLKAGGVITGRVTNPPTGLGDVTILAVPSDQGVFSGATTRLRSDGTYRLENAPTGSVRVTASAGQMAQRRMSEPKTVQVVAGSEATADLEFRADKISGRVTRNGAPVDSAFVVFIPRDANMRTSANTQTSRDGTYEVSGLVDGDYYVNVNDSSQSVNYETRYTVRGGGRFDIDMKTASLHGRVVDADNGEAIAEADIAIGAANGMGGFSRASRSSGADGTFTADTIAAGSYRITARKSGYGVGSTTVDISANESADAEIKLRKTEGVTIRMYDARDGSPVEASYIVRDAANNVVMQDGMSNRADGTATIPLSNGSYRIAFRTEGLAGATIRVNAPTSGVISIPLTPGGSMLIGSDRQQITRARLVTGSGDVWEASYRVRLTGEFGVDPGSTRIDNIVPGRYTLQVIENDGTVSASIPVTIVEGQTSNVKI